MNRQNLFFMFLGHFTRSFVLTADTAKPGCKMLMSLSSHVRVSLLRLFSYGFWPSSKMRKLCFLYIEAKERVGLLMVKTRKFCDVYVSGCAQWG